MTIKNHGVWLSYVPDPWPSEAIPRSVLFSKSSTDGEDWYDYNHAEQNFGVLTVKAVLHRKDVQSPWRVRMASRDVTRLFPADGETIVEVTSDTGSTDASEYHGRILSGGELVDEPVDLVAYAKRARWLKETSNLTLAGHKIAMDDRSKSLILGGYITAQRTPSWTTIWQGEDGEFSVDASTIAAIFDAMQARINACFTTYATVAAGISGGTVTTTTAIDEAFSGVA